MRRNAEAVITGRGVASPLGVGVASHARRLFEGRSVISTCGPLLSLGLGSGCGGEIPQEELESALALIPRKQRRLMNRATLLAAAASSLALQEAGLKPQHVESARLGVSLATWFTAYELVSFIRFVDGSEGAGQRMDPEKANRSWMEGMNPLDYSLKVLPNLAGGHLAILHQAGGYCGVVADPWRGGLLAIAQGVEAIRRGDLDVVLAGGTEASLDAGVFCDLVSMGLSASNGFEPSRLSRPFDKQRSGAVVGEGAAVIILEEKEHALSRGAVIHGEICGVGSAGPGSDSRREGVLALAMEKSLAASETDPGSIDLIHANGDSTIENDDAELKAISSVFGRRGLRPPVTATKSLHGHLLSASGAVELVSCLIMLERGMIAPVANCESAELESGVDLVRGSPRRDRQVKTALLNAFGLYGEATSLVVKR